MCVHTTLDLFFFLPSHKTQCFTDVLSNPGDTFPCIGDLLTLTFRASQRPVEPSNSEEIFQVKKIYLNRGVPSESKIPLAMILENRLSSGLRLWPPRKRQRML